MPELPLEELSGRRSSIFPPIPKRAAIGDYTGGGELQTLYRWVASDRQLRTHDEIADEMFAALPFTRRGSKIEAALRDTVNNFACRPNRPDAVGKVGQRPCAAHARRHTEAPTKPVQHIGGSAWHLRSLS